MKSNPSCVCNGSGPAGRLEIVGYIAPALRTCAKLNRLPLAKQALTLAILSLLKRRQDVAPTQWEVVTDVLQSTAGEYIDVTIPLKLLRTGIAYFTNQGEKALLELTKEERDLFLRELDLHPITAAE